LISPAEFLIIKRYLKPKRKEGILKVISIFSFLGIGLGVATLIIVMSVMNGFRSELINKLLLFQPHISVYQFSDFDLAKDKITELLKIQNIKSKKVNLTYSIQSLVITNNANKGVVLRGLNKKDFLNDELVNKKIIDGNISKFGNNYISIGSNLAEQLGVWVDKEITILSSKKESTPLGNLPEQYTFKIGSVYKSGIYEFDNNYIIFDVSTSQDFLSGYAKDKNIEIRLENPDLAEKVKNILSNQTFQVFSWIDNNKSFYDALLIERNVMFIILTLIIIVASFNIISGLTILVKNKTKEVAILKTLGFSSYSINKIFFITGSTIGSAGTVFGVLLGVLFSNYIENIRLFLSSAFNIEIFPAEIYFLSQMPSEIHWPTIILISIVSLLITFLASIFPSIKASKVNPIESLKYE
jgi:lipoprotein-releasing system permease protein